MEETGRGVAGKWPKSPGVLWANAIFRLASQGTALIRKATQGLKAERTRARNTNYCGESETQELLQGGGLTRAGILGRG